MAGIGKILKTLGYTLLITVIFAHELKCQDTSINTELAKIIIVEINWTTAKKDTFLFRLNNGAMFESPGLLKPFKLEKIVDSEKLILSYPENIIPINYARKLLNYQLILLLSEQTCFRDTNSLQQTDYCVIFLGINENNK